MSVALKKLRIAEEEVESLKAQLTAVQRERDEAVTTIRLLDADLSVIRKKLDEVRAPSDPERHTTPLIIRIERLAAERDEYESRWKEAVLEADNAYDDVRVELAELWNDALSGTPKPVRIIEPLESHYRLTLELRAELATLRDGWIPATYEVCPDCEGDGHFGLDGQNEFCKCKKCAGKGYVGTPAHQSADGWISVTERLPEGVGPVLMITRMGNQYVVRLGETKKLWHGDNNLCLVVEGTLWRDLPAPPTDGRAE